jgi:hypothetical protein
MVGGMITIEGGRGAITMRMAQIKNRTARRPATKDDGSSRQWSGQWTMEQGRTQQLTINGSGKGEQWLVKVRVRGQRLAMR